LQQVLCFVDLIEGNCILAVGLPEKYRGIPVSTATTNARIDAGGSLLGIVDAGRQIAAEAFQWFIETAVP
jgi:hypothetical protein